MAKKGPNFDGDFGLQINPGTPSAVGTLLYSLGLPVFSGGQTHNIYHDQMMAGNFRPRGTVMGGMATGGGQPMAGGGDQVVNFTPGGGRNRVRGGLMGLNYRLMR